jgi:hypothetical protein
MGWVESAPYFCAASKTAQDVAVQYIETKIGLLPQHKFKQWGGAEVSQINDNTPTRELRYVLKVYMDNYIAAIVPTSQAQITYVARGILHGIHNVSPPSNNNSKDPISAKKLQKGNSTFKSKKCMLGFDFDGGSKTIWLEE